MRRTGQGGFTLVEIVIVVTLVALLAALAVPSLLRSRLLANETGAIKSTRTLVTAIEIYRSAQVPPGYPRALSDLSNAVPPYIDASLAQANSRRRTRQGYYYVYRRLNSSRYRLWAFPYPRGVSGNRQFYTDESGVIRAATTGRAGPNSPPLE